MAHRAPKENKGDSNDGIFPRWKHSLTAIWCAITPRELHSSSKFAKYLPLVAALIAPLSTLLDIAGLAEPWFANQAGRKYRDSPGCIALGTIGLFLNIVGNLLLLVRFSGTKLWRKGANLSLLFWIGKTIIALINCFYYGISRNVLPQHSFTEGFWASVASVIMSGVITICLGFNVALAIDKINTKDAEDLRVTGRKFLFSVTFFMFLIAMQALAYCRLEHWSYLDSIYFSIQTATTVGYGDLYPTTAVGKVLLFPFVVLTISQLANEVSIIISFVQNRSQHRRDKWKKRYSVTMHAQALKRRPYATLIDEMSLIHQINLHQEVMVQLLELFWSVVMLATFWLIGALIFHYIEGWGYGNAVYAVMVLTVTIGFGDFTPKTPSGRVIWIVYALMAIPVVTNFAVQTVTGIISTWSEHRFARNRFEMERDRDPEIFAPHSHFILRYHEKWDNLRDKYLDTKEKADDEIKSFYQLKISTDGQHGARGGTPLTTPTTTTATTSGTVRNLPLPPSADRAPHSSGSLPLTQSGTSAGSATFSSPGSGHNGARSPTHDQHYPSPAEQKVIDQMLRDPMSHDAVVSVLGSPEVESGDSGVPASGSDDGNAQLESEQQEVNQIEQEADAQSNPSSSPSASTKVGEDDSGKASVSRRRGNSAFDEPRISIDDAATRRVAKREAHETTRDIFDETPTSGTTMTGNATTAPSSTGFSFSPAMGPRLAETDRDPNVPGHTELTGDAMLDSNHMELHLIKELVDRVTRLEAQGRQMLIDTMGQDIAQTLLIADRNLQIRDAFELYHNKIDLGKTYKEEADKTQADRDQSALQRAKALGDIPDHTDDNDKNTNLQDQDVQNRAAIIDDVAGSDDDMLARVRRYRNTFAEILVISSMLLKLEGNDLRRFERWHVVQLREEEAPAIGSATDNGTEAERRGKKDSRSGLLNGHAQKITSFLHKQRPGQGHRHHVHRQQHTASDGRDETTAPRGKDGAASRHVHFRGRTKMKEQKGGQAYAGGADSRRAALMAHISGLLRDPTDSGEYNAGLSAAESATIPHAEGHGARRFNVPDRKAGPPPASTTSNSRRLSAVPSGSASSLAAGVSAENHTPLSRRWRSSASSRGHVHNAHTRQQQGHDQDADPTHGLRRLSDVDKQLHAQVKNRRSHRNRFMTDALLSRASDEAHEFAQHLAQAETSDVNDIEQEASYVKQRESEERRRAQGSAQDGKHAIQATHEHAATDTHIFGTDTPNTPGTSGGMASTPPPVHPPPHRRHHGELAVEQRAGLAKQAEEMEELSHHVHSAAVRRHRRDERRQEPERETGKELPRGGGSRGDGRGAGVGQ